MNKQQLNRVIDKARHLCKSSGTRLTEKRRGVLEALLVSKIPLSAYEITDVINQADDKSILAMSVYRILEFLEAENLVHKLSSTNKYVACSHITCGHNHEIPQFLIYFSIFLSVVFLVRADSYLGFLNNNEFRFFDPRTNNKINIEIGFEKINENWVRPLDQDQCWSNTKCTLTKYEIELLKDRTFKIAYAK